MSISIEKAKKHIKDLGFNTDLDYKIYQDALKYFIDKDDLNGLVEYMSQIQNCGGYALEIPVCIWPVNNYTFEEKVLRIMDLYPFVRLLSDSELKEDEYIVRYRAQGNGHHFIKITDNGEIIEKNSSGLPQKFNSWETLEDAPEAVFAVVKQEYRDEKMKKLPQCNRNMCLDDDAYECTEDGYTEIITRTAEKPATFDRTLKEAYNNRNSTFTYNNKKFSLKIEKDDKDLIYICDENAILGTVYTEGETFIIEIEKEKENAIFGFKPTSEIQINNSKEQKQENNILEIGE